LSVSAEGKGVMDDKGPSPAIRRSRGWTALLVACLASSQCGCSLFVMAGKAIFGDPKIASAFKQQTKVDLAKADKKIAIVCSTPHSVKKDYPSVEFDLIDGVTRRLKRRGVDVVNPDRVATWMDDKGGYHNNPEELAKEVGADYVVHIDLDRFTLREENSPSLWRGNILGKVIAFQIVDVGGQQAAQRVFEREYTSLYPKHNPISEQQKSLKMFSKEYLDQVSAELARMFHDFRLSEEVK
jgi:hypothetical protein